MKNPFPWLASVGVLTLGAVGSAEKEVEVDFEGLGKSFIEAYCTEPVGSEGCTLRDVADRKFARLRMGAFEIFYPPGHLAEKSEAQDLREVALAIADLQLGWLGWVADEELDLGAFEAVRAWIEGWKPSALKGLVEAENKDLVLALGAPEEVREALSQVDELMHDGSVAGITPGAGRYVRLFCAPRRRDFMEVVGFLGLMRSELKDAFWVDGVHEWAQLQWGSTLVLALEYAPWSGFDPEFKTGKSMKDFEETGLTEHVIQRSATIYLKECLGRELDRVEAGLPLNLTIEICGQVNTMDGDGARGHSGNQSQPYERFVPGGNPAGGVLPPAPVASGVLVENQWRVGGGADHFTKPLRKGQKDGAKKASKDKQRANYKDGISHFLLKEAEGSGQHIVSAPFLGELASEQAYPPFEFVVDYREFFRSYKASFLNWLRRHGVEGSPEESEQRFRSLLRRLNEASDEARLQALIEELYEMPLSGRSEDDASLEWRYLGWLKKGK